MFNVLMCEYGYKMHLLASSCQSVYLSVSAEFPWMIFMKFYIGMSY
jgi:hypothetical protein